MKKRFLFAVMAMMFMLAKAENKVSAIATAQNDSIVVKKLADGSSCENAIIITETTEDKGVAAEYKWIKQNYPDASVRGQSCSGKNKKRYDIIDIITKLGEKKSIYFDITNFYGKF
ncbi:MAG: hypothetical protein Q8909_06460 [Bacteroidota bacterium]|nr:hypothetical protein [Bacteroidota bacterium]